MRNKKVDSRGYNDNDNDNAIQRKVLQDFRSDDQEALWAFLRPKRLPRGFSNLIDLFSLSSLFSHFRPCDILWGIVPLSI